MSWITDDWRLKVLAFGLAALMLGAVAFSQNPPTIRTLSVPLSYALAKDIVIISPPTKVNVTVQGLADVIGAVTTDNLTASADAAQASPGAAVTLSVAARYTGAGGVTVVNPAPIVVTIDTFVSKALPVEVIARPAPGWAITKQQATCGSPPAACTVNFSGPASWVNGLHAQVVYPQPISFNSLKSPGWPVSFVYSNGQSFPNKTTEPQTTWDVSTVGLDIEAQQAAGEATVPLLASTPANGPPPQYEITGITISPLSVIISGDPAVLGKIQQIFLPAIDLSGATSTTKVTVTIPYPDNVSGNVASASITYTIKRNPNVTPSP